MRYQRFPILEYGNMEIRNTVRVYGTYPVFASTLSTSHIRMLSESLLRDEIAIKLECMRVYGLRYVEACRYV